MTRNGTISDAGAPREGELELINKFTRRNLTADEVYVFSVVLCDNEIDRDFERFSINALSGLSKLYVGKTGLFDHSLRGRDQCARIFSCAVEKVPDTYTRGGEEYHRLVARAYMPRTEKSRELILEIDAGIKKEVSVGCSVASTKCSVCGAEPAGECGHRKGRFYRKDGKKQLCYVTLDEPTDAYEWSFVAVPAQPKAGVIKAFSAKEKSMDKTDILKTLSSGGEICLTEEEGAAIAARIKQMDEICEAAGEFLAEERRELIKAFGAEEHAVPVELFAAALDRLSPAELFALCRKAAPAELCAPQLSPKSEKKGDSLGLFKIK